MKNIKGLQVLETEDFNHFCPSFYATEPKHGVSDKYAFLNTREISLQLWDEGWMPVYAREARSIDPTNRGFTRHVIRWAHSDFAINGERIELVGVNSHNRAASFRFMAGIFRLVCSNGMITKTADFGSFSIRHIGDIQAQVTEAIKQVSGVAGSIAHKMDEFRAIDLTPNEQGIYAVAAHKYLYKDPEMAPIKPSQLLLTRRQADEKTDLWTTFNRVQENVMKGGLRGRNVKTLRRVKTRRIQSIEKDVKLNQALWSLTEHMAELKQTA